MQFTGVSVPSIFSMYVPTIKVIKQFKEVLGREYYGQIKTPTRNKHLAESRGLVTHLYLAKVAINFT